MSENELILVVDCALDSVTQQLRFKDKVNLVKIERQLHYALKALRRLTETRYGPIALRQYTLKRCKNKDELPWNGPRSKARSDWYRYKRERKAARVQEKLSEGR